MANEILNNEEIERRYKLIAFYLPQFHTIPENDEWWGKGFTEWVNVRGAKPLFEGHNQPRVPYANNYYDLSKVETLKWQCELARKHGIYGFAMYHYWFNGHLLLEKPMEMLLAHPEIDINYCISWANHDWTDAWKAKDRAPRTLIALDFDDEQDWVDHFNYMLPFFKDKRYIKEDNKPMVIIYIPNVIGKLNKMLDLWTEMARKEGFEGLSFVYQYAQSAVDTSWDRSRFSHGIEMNPQYINLVTKSQAEPQVQLASFRLLKIIKKVKKFLGIQRSLYWANYKKHDEVRRVDYDICWQEIIAHKPADGTMLPCAFTDWDNTPRHQSNGYLYDGVTPEKFKKYFKELLEKSDKEYASEYIFIFAWNEWAEGGYLEPDEKYGSAFLEAIRDSLTEMVKTPLRSGK
ncbi:MAG: glycoside hydrolase family 99-like domain-containing protein [Muribaculaceae bacterium]|nr:glycoside hydrolase family 99-like domain-containing protein [Muribaculaceae bacterium]